MPHISPKSLAESACPPTADELGLALTLLRHAYFCARDADAPPWDFALEIGKLYEAGLTITSLRWLVVKGFVEHGGEISAYGDKHRSFTRSDGCNFLTTTCVVLTKKGAALVRRGWHTPAATNAASDSRLAGEEGAPGTPGKEPGSRFAAICPVARTQAKPLWDPARRELSLDGGMVKCFRVPAQLQELILTVFQEEGWPEGIEDPLTGPCDANARARLNDVVYRLNRSQVNRLIHFSTNGNGIHWSFCELPTS